jgi:hypothetical protein
MTNGLFDLAIGLRRRILLLLFVVALIVLAVFAGWQLISSDSEAQAVGGGCSAMKGPSGHRGRG